MHTVRFSFNAVKGPSSNQKTEDPDHSSIWQYAYGQVVFSWYPPNQDLSVKLPEVIHMVYLSKSNDNELYIINQHLALHGEHSTHCVWLLGHGNHSCSVSLCGLVHWGWEIVVPREDHFTVITLILAVEIL